MLKVLLLFSALVTFRAHADQVSHPLLDDKGAWPMKELATGNLQKVAGMSHIYKVSGPKGSCWNLSVRSKDFAPTIVIAKGKASAAFGAYVSPETVDEYGRIFSSAGVTDRQWVTAMSVCSSSDSDVYLLVGRGWVWVEQPSQEGGFVQKLERQGGLGGEYSLYGTQYN